MNAAIGMHADYLLHKPKTTDRFADLKAVLFPDDLLTAQHYMILHSELNGVGMRVARDLIHGADSDRKADLDLDQSQHQTAIIRRNSYPSSNSPRGQSSPSRTQARASSGSV